MNFLSPALLVGLIGMIIPPILHLLLRRKPKVVRFPALEFVLRAHKKTSRSFRIRQIMLMTVRSLLLGIVAFSLARPILNDGAEGRVTAEQARGAMVFVVDTSYAMDYRLDGEALIDRVRIRISNILSQSQASAGLIMVGEETKAPLSELTADVGAIRRQLDEIKLSHGVGRLDEGIMRGLELLEDEPKETSRTIFVFSTPAGLQRASEIRYEQDRAKVVFVDVSEGKPLPNCAVLGVSVEPAPTMGSGYWKIAARIRNFGSRAISTLPIRLEVDNKVLVNGFVDLSADEETEKVFFLPLNRDTAAAAFIIIGTDPLTVDNRYPFWLHPAPTIRVLAVNGDPQPTPYKDELFYLDRAIEPALSQGARMKLKIAEVDTVQRKKLKDFDVVILANIPELAPRDARALEGFVRSGGGLLVTSGARVVPGRINNLIGSLLPRTLRSSRMAGDAAASAEGRDRRVGFLEASREEHPILANFSPDDLFGLKQIRVSRYMLLEPTPSAGGRTVLSLDDGSPILLTKTVEKGRVGLLATSLDRDWTDLPIRVHFLPLLVQTVRYLARTQAMDSTTHLVGQKVVLKPSAASIDRVQIEAPDGVLHTQSKPTNPTEPWVFEDTTRLGHYHVRPDPPMVDGDQMAGFAVALDTQASNLGAYKAKGNTENEGQSKASQVGKEPPVELWHMGLALLFLLLLAEAGLIYGRQGDAPFTDRGESSSEAATQSPSV